MAKKQQRKITVLLADDHPLLRKGFTAALADFPDIAVVGAVGDLDEAGRLYQRHKPDVIVLDIMFSGKKTGIDAIESVLSMDSSAKMIVLTQFDQDNLIREAYKRGAMAFITKNADIDQLITAIRKASGGERHFMPSIAQRLAELATRPEKSSLELLAPREREVLGLIGQGNTAQEIAARLKISQRTVVNVTQSIKGKLGVSRRSDLIQTAQRHGLTEAWP